MITIHIPAREYFDERTETFENYPARSYKLEHSLLSISKWESKWHKPFIERDKEKKKSLPEELDYIRCMAIGDVPDEKTLYAIPASEVQRVSDYINDSMTATWFNEKKEGRTPDRHVITSEIIYYWMISHSIPFECEKWHLNRLLTLIRVCNIKAGGQKKMSKQEAAAQRRALNAQRKQKYHTKG